jgi:hypothetical protein
LPELAASLNDYGILLAELGRRLEALGPSREAVEIRRRLVEANHDAWLHGLAASLHTLGTGCPGWAGTGRR